MRVDWAVLCRYAEVSNDGTASLLGAALDSLWLPELPAQVGIFLMMRITGVQDEFEEGGEFEIRLVSPDREETTILQAGFKLEDFGPLFRRGMQPGLLVAAVMNWEAVGLRPVHTRGVHRRPPREVNRHLGPLNF